MRFKHNWSKDGLWWFDCSYAEFDERNSLIFAIVKSDYVKYPFIRVWQLVIGKYRCSLGWGRRVK